MTKTANTFLKKALLIDLETSQQHRLLKIGAILGDKQFIRRGIFDEMQALVELDHFAEGAEYVIGHNLVRHDMVVIVEKTSNLKLLHLPVIDTLFLSPICFPENPYHRLVKDYKLVSESLNDPVSDARLAGVLANDEIQSLHGMSLSAPDIFRCLEFLLCQGNGHDSQLIEGMKVIFDVAGGLDIPEEEEGRSVLYGLFSQMACCTASKFLCETDFSSSESRWALAYVLSWLRVAGGDSVLPPWVRLENRLVVPLIEALRDVPCDDPACAYCSSVHSPEAQLKRFFGFDGFRPTPQDSEGSSLQRRIVQAGMRNESLLAIMPTGSGKSLCFQLPALVRNFRRGQLTIVISPLQALMKDQVDGLVRRTGLHNAAALYGLLTPLEREAVLRGVRMGNIGILYVAPEQLRSRSFRNAILKREIGCWVIDEVHCLSKWGHDFRPDYLYIGRFIRELSKVRNEKIPSVACFTATAKREVVLEIVEYFRRELNMELIRYEGGVERENLHFEVQAIGTHAKLQRINDLLNTRLPSHGEGSAIVFRSTCRDAEETAEFLINQGWQAGCFHARLSIPEKKRIQDAFISGKIRVICATTAFGMGIDKDDVRLVIHADIPSSLENYLQEAGRAGRDRKPSECVLLYNEEDCEQQFRIGAFAELRQRDIQQILRVLRKTAMLHKSDEIVITTGELIRDEDVNLSFDIQDVNADTKARTAVAWLERAGFIERSENRTNVIQAKLLVNSIEEAKQRIAKLNLSQCETELWLAIVREMLNADQMDMISVDEIVSLQEFQSYITSLESYNSSSNKQMRNEKHSQNFFSAKVFKILNSMMEGRILKKDILLTAYVRYKVADHSQIRLQRTLNVDRELVKLLCELEPDPEGWLQLNLRLLNDTLIRRGVESSVEMVRKLLKSLSEDGRGFSGQAGSIELRFIGRDIYMVRVRREWTQVSEIAERRRQVAEILLAELMQQVPPDTPPYSAVLVEFTFETMAKALEKNILLRSSIHDINSAIERGLMFLHEQNVIILQRGLTIFRSAMTIRVLPEAAKERYTAEQYQALQHHYYERIFQVHVMNEYAKYGLRKIKSALELVLAYFTMEKETFTKKFFGTNREFLERATTARSYQIIVDSLANRDQIRIVTQTPNRNLLILAGPGAGKTKTIVHRCAYLIRVKRVQPQAILVCCFNHKAAVELRKRLVALVGRDAFGITVQTYHGLALRILGVSCINMVGKEDADFNKLITDAIDVLRGKRSVPGIEPEEVRDRLLSGFEYILVDEYQDIDSLQYDMISAIAGRTLKDKERKLSIMAVGDDDQSIYGFRGANVEFIRRFKEDYEADVAYLVENYRSTRYIIEASNRFISHNRDRMKTDHPIKIDQGRALLPPGGVFGDRDALTRGRVALIEIGDVTTQAVAIIREIQRLRSLGATNWGDIAVLSRTRHPDLAFVRTVAEAEGIPISWALEHNKIPALYCIREIWQALNYLSKRRNSTCKTSEVMNELGLSQDVHCDNPWKALLYDIMQAFAEETSDEVVPVNVIIEDIYEAIIQRRRDEQFGRGVILNTIHSAKGTEYAHVLLCGDWQKINNSVNIEEERRVFYVGMTRARHTLTIFNRIDSPNPFIAELVGPCFISRRETCPQISKKVEVRDYILLGLDDVFLDYAGLYNPTHPIHTALASIQPGDKLKIAQNEERLALIGPKGVVVAQLSLKASNEWRENISKIEEIRVIYMFVRQRSDCKEMEHKSSLKADTWEIPLCEFVIKN